MLQPLLCEYSQRNFYWVVLFDGTAAGFRSTHSTLAGEKRWSLLRVHSVDELRANEDSSLSFVLYSNWFHDVLKYVEMRLSPCDSVTHGRATSSSSSCPLWGPDAACPRMTTGRYLRLHIERWLTGGYFEVQGGQRGDRGSSQGSRRMWECGFLRLLFFCLLRKNYK